ncbi:hypothetical protein N431DRAFT_512361 [Stipitochalara longipes BDJ]|nr:hypothetical protein N431DRAFT_512361 [Stipitochalara longipes BDJ]
MLVTRPEFLGKGSRSSPQKRIPELYSVFIGRTKMLALSVSLDVDALGCKKPLYGKAGSRKCDPHSTPALPIGAIASQASPLLLLFPLVHWITKIKGCENLTLSAAKLLWANALFFTLARGSFLPSRDTCASGEYWCQDRCGSDAYGDTCCETPNGQHNLCGAGTICCLYGCCPTGTVCNAVGGCDSPDTTPQPHTSESVSGSGPAPSNPSSCGAASIITSQTTVTNRQINTVFITVTFVETCTVESTSSSISSSSSSLLSESTTSSSGIASPSSSLSSQGVSSSSGSFSSSPSISSQGVSSSSGSFSSSPSLSSGSFTSSLKSISSVSSTGPFFQATTWTEPDGAIVVSSSSVLIINGSVTIPISPVSTPTTFTTDGETFTLLPPSSSTPTGLASTFTEPDGQTVVSSGSFFIIGGSETVSIPSVSVPTTLVTDGETFTFFPPTSSSSTVFPLTTVEPDGQTVISSSGVLIIGSNTVTLPTISSATTLTTDGETFTLNPPGPPSSSSPGPSGPLTTTFPDGQSEVSSSGVVIIGGKVSSSGVIVLGGSLTITVPSSLTAPTTVTTDGETFTWQPSAPTSSAIPTIPCIVPPVTACVPCPIATQGCWPTSQLPCALPPVSGCWPFGGSVPATTTSSSSSTTSLPIFATWPSDATIKAVPTTSSGGGGGGGGTSSCKMWFFFICIDTPSLQIGGWDWINFPPGIYPPTPPPFPIINLPTPWTIQGTLPPWPSITIGTDGQPTFSSEPDDGCKTETGSMCETTTSFGVSGTITTTTNVASSCATILGCDITNTATTATKTGSVCSTTTVTDFWVTCSGGPDCSTTSSATVTGCSVTATTTTTGSFCPLATYDPTIEDEGDDGGGVPFSTPGVFVTSTFGESVVVSGTVYPVVGGSALIGSSTFSIPSVMSQVDTTLSDGESATILPTFVASYLSITDPAMTLVPIFPLPTPTPSSTSSTSPTTSSSSTVVSITGTGPTITGPSSSSPLPTLSSFVSPTASSCLSSATFTTCEPGPGGQSACTAVPTCVSWVAKSTSTVPTTTSSIVPAPTGGFYLGQITFPGATDFIVIPAGAADCTFLQTKYNPVGLIAIQSDSNGQAGSITLAAGATFSLQGVGLPSYYPLCGQPNLVLNFRPAEINPADYEYSAVPNWVLGQPPAGYCSPVTPTTCTAASDSKGSEVVTALWQCENIGDPTFCSAAPTPT